MKVVIEITDELVESLLYDHGTDSWMHDATGDWRTKGIVCVFDKESDDEGDGTGRTTLKRDDVERGLAVMAKESPNQFGQLLDDNADRVTADTFYQCMIFGKLIYG